MREVADALAEALQWYAEPTNWKRRKTGRYGKRGWSKPSAEIDAGSRARFILETLRYRMKSSKP